MDDIIQNEIERYLNNELNTEERILFEQQMENDNELKENVLLQASINDVFSNGNATSNSFKDAEINKIKTVLRSKEHQNIVKNIEANSLTYLAKRKSVLRKKNIYKSLLAIAAILILAITITPLLTNSNGQLYNDYANWNDMPSFVEKGTDENDLVLIEKHYDSQNYELVISTINSFPETKIRQYPNLSIYLGASYFHNNDYEKAITVFNNFSQSDAYDSSKGYWYKALIYLKQNKLEAAKKVLQIITKNSTNYKHNEASKLLKAIE